ncbi:lytic transglycosylase domain-containing protein [bacterium]|nr:lytic transglycosylase domain-containing protein [bacterium]
MMAPVRLNRRTGVKMSTGVAVLMMALVVAQFGFMFYIYAYKDNQLETMRRQVQALEARIRELDDENRQLREQVRIKAIIEDLNSSLSPEQKMRIGKAVWEQSRLHGCSPLLIMALIITESSVRPEAKSPRNAHGLMQLLPEVGLDLSLHVAELLAPEEAASMGWTARAPEHLYDPETNIKLGMLYFAQLLDRFDGDLALAIRAYNAGPTAIARKLRQGEGLPEGYLSRVMANYRMLQEKYKLDRVPDA